MDCWDGYHAEVTSCPPHHFPTICLYQHLRARLRISTM